VYVLVGASPILDLLVWVLRWRARMELGLSSSLAERLGLDPQTYDALQRGDPLPVLLSLLSDRSSRSSDPVLTLLLQLMAEQQRSALSRPDPEEPSPVGQLQARAVAEPAGVQTCARILLSRVAQLLGACPSCCGQDHLCPICQGTGGPGTTTPDGRLRDWVAPALSRFTVEVIEGE
jgi:hypothetical protein